MAASQQPTNLPNSSPSDLITPLRDASRKLVREWGFLRPTFAGSALSPAAVHCLIEIGDNDMHHFSDLRSELKVSSQHLDQILSSLTTAGHITLTSASSYHITPTGQHVLLEINAYGQDQVFKALAAAPPDAATNIITAFRQYTSALKQSATSSRRLTPETSRPTSPTPVLASPATPQLTISRGYRPGLLGRCLEMHMDFYPAVNGWGVEFEAGLAELVGDVLLRLDRPVNEAFAAIQTLPPAGAGLPGKERIVGTVFIDGESAGREGAAKLRAFIVDDVARGTGVGRRLFEAAMGFVRETGFDECRLVTTRSLVAARRLYEAVGFTEVGEREAVCWGVRLMELEYVWRREGGGQP